MTAPLTQAAECAAKFATTREAYNRQVENDALRRYADSLFVARDLITSSHDADPLTKASSRALAAHIVERAGLDVCRALGEA